MKTEHPDFHQSPELESGLSNRFAKPVVDVPEVLEILARQHSWLGHELRKSQTALREATVLGNAEAIRSAAQRIVELSSQAILVKDLGCFITDDENPFCSAMEGLG